MLIQLDLFDQDEEVLLRREIEKVKETCDKVRRGIYSKHNELSKILLDVHERLNILERNICLEKKQKTLWGEDLLA